MTIAIYHLKSHITCDNIGFVMQRTHVYLPDELSQQIYSTAKLTRKSKAEVIRVALEYGLKTIRPPKSQSAKALLEMVKEARKFAGSGPKDLSINHDHYTWGGPKRDPRAKV